METYEIKGMTCEHCLRAVERALSRVPGVQRVRALDLASGRAEIDPGAPDEAAVVAAIRDVGYAARRAGGHDGGASATPGPAGGNGGTGARAR